MKQRGTMYAKNLSLVMFLEQVEENDRQKYRITMLPALKYGRVFIHASSTRNDNVGLSTTLDQT